MGWRPSALSADIKLLAYLYHYFKILDLAEKACHGKALLPGNTNRRGIRSTGDLLIKVACYTNRRGILSTGDLHIKVTKVNDILNIKMSSCKLVSTRRLTVLRLPFR